MNLNLKASTQIVLGLMIFASVSCITSVANSAPSVSDAKNTQVVQANSTVVESAVTHANAKEPVVEVPQVKAKAGFLSPITTKKNDYKHLSPVEQTWYKCTKKDSQLFTVPFPYEQYMCYRYCDSVARVGGQCEKWIIKRYHFVSDHQLMVDRGAWIVR